MRSGQLEVGACKEIVGSRAGALYKEELFRLQVVELCWDALLGVLELGTSDEGPQHCDAFPFSEVRALPPICPVQSVPVATRGLPVPTGRPNRYQEDTK